MFTITYDPTKDAKNWIRLSEQYSAEFTLTQYYPFDRTIPVRRDNLERMAASIPGAALNEFQAMAKRIQSAWQDKEHIVVQAIANYLRMPAEPMSAKAALTTAYRMPYDFADRWFMIPTHKPLSGQLRTIVHELFHFYYITKNPQSDTKEREAAVEQFLQTLPNEVHLAPVT